MAHILPGEPGGYNLFGVQWRIDHLSDKVFIVSAAPEVTSCDVHPGGTVEAVVRLPELAEVRVVVHLVMAEAELVLTAVTVRTESSTRPTELTAHALRMVKLPALRRAVVNHLIASGVEIGARRAERGKAGSFTRKELTEQAAAQFLGVDPEVVGAIAKRGVEGHKWTDARLRAVAVEALRFQATSDGSVRHHLAAWLRERGESTATDATAREVMKRARQRGFLAEAPHGSRRVEPGAWLPIEDRESIAIPREGQA